MKVSINWLREYVDFACSIDELASRLTMAGLEVEETAKLTRQDFTAAGGGGLADDTVFDCKVTPNRGDWLSMIGVARETAPLVGSKARIPDPKVDGSEPASSELINISIDDPDLCGRYIGVVVRNVKIKDSPDWMKDRLIAAGMRPINNVVDITNYVMLELGQPLHAFDLRLLHGSRIIVRRARPGETITSLDGVERKLDPDMLVIADSERPVALAGVMGGIISEISERTEDILIESANFNSVSTRRTSKRLAMVTEASYRFEREVDPSIAATAALRAAELIRDLEAGEVAKGIVDVYPGLVEAIELTVRPERVNAILGTEIEPDAMAGYLNDLEIETAVRNDRLVCKVPTFRRDITGEIDLIEEIGRAYGYDNLGMTLPHSSLQGADSPEGVFRDRVRRILMSCGAQEVLTHSLIDPRLIEITGKKDLCVGVRNPLCEDLGAMRAMLIPNLLQVIARNQAFGTPNVSVFEIGKVYFRASDGQIGEKLSIAGAMVGNLFERAWSLPESALDVDFFTCKGMVENLLDGLGIRGAEFAGIRHPALHPTRAAKVMLAGSEIGILGEVSPETSELLDVRGRPCVFGIDFDALMKASPETPKYVEPPRYPALYRHLAVVVSDSVPYARLLEVIEAAGGDVVESIDLLDVYKGSQIAAGCGSLTISITFRSRERTLTDEETNEVLGRIREALACQLGAGFR